MYNPVTYNGTELYFRGSLILDLVINYVLQSEGMKDADKIILSGNSGMAIFLNNRLISLISIQRITYWEEVNLVMGGNGSK